MSGRFYCLGTSNGEPSNDRNHAAYLLDCGEKKYLFDAGEPISQTLYKRGIDLKAIQSIFISHLHADHTGGLPMLLQSMWLDKRTEPLTIYIPSEGVELFKYVLPRMYLF